MGIFQKLQALFRKGGKDRATSAAPAPAATTSATLKPPAVSEVPTEWFFDVRGTIYGPFAVERVQAMLQTSGTGGLHLGFRGEELRFIIEWGVGIGGGHGRKISIKRGRGGRLCRLADASSLERLYPEIAALLPQTQPSREESLIDAEPIFNAHGLTFRGDVNGWEYRGKTVDAMKDELDVDVVVATIQQVQAQLQAQRIIVLTGNPRLVVFCVKPPAALILGLNSNGAANLVANIVSQHAMTSVEYRGAWLLDSPR